MSLVSAFLRVLILPPVSKLVLIRRSEVYFAEPSHDVFYQAFLPDVSLRSLFQAQESRHASHNGNLVERISEIGY